MIFDINRIQELASLASKKDKIDLTEEEIKFMSDIFTTIINSEDWDSAIKYLAGINGMKKSDIIIIRSIYLLYLANTDEKLMYSSESKKRNARRRKQGFIDFSVMFGLVIFIGVIGISLAILIYN